MYQGNYNSYGGNNYGGNNGYGRPEGRPPYGGGDGYGRPEGRPPYGYEGEDQYSGYSRPPVPPSGNNDGGYGRPMGPPPGAHQHRFDESGSGGYNRPSGPPPGWSNQQVQQQVQTQSYFQEQNIGNDVQIQSPGTRLVQPPTHAQSFGVEGYNYQYSNCSGKRKALLVGINYIGSSNQLNGCINDVRNVANFLQNQYGFSADNMVILTDDQTNLRSVPTGQNIRDAMKWLVKDAQPNDSLFFHYSGHGGQTKDLDGDEYDGYDEVIYPVDFQTNGHIVDDELHDALVKTLQPGVRLTALFDSCHSGSCLDLPYMYSTKGVLKEPNLAEEAGSGLLTAFTSYMSGDTSGVIKGIKGLISLATNGGPNSAAMQKQKQTKTSPADVIMISGCKDDQTSADAKENGVSTGAMSYSFIKVMGTNNNQSYLSLLQNMRAVLQSKYTQKPQLSASHPIDVNLKFIL